MLIFIEEYLRQETEESKHMSNKTSNSEKSVSESSVTDEIDSEENKELHNKSESRYSVDYFEF